MDIFNALVMNLNHPGRTIRLKTAQEISKLLQPPNLDTYKPKYLAALKSCKLEMDVCGLLVALSGKKASPSIPYDEIRANISAPSILADRMLSSLYQQQIPSISWANGHSGVAPKDFSRPELLNKQSANYDESYLRTIKGFSSALLETQFYWEWDNLWKKFDGHSFNYQYFHDNSYDRVSGSMEARQLDLLKSAFLRTLAIAHSKYKLPLETLNNASISAAPVNFDYFAIEPQQPPNLWPQPTGKKGGSYSITSLSGNLLNDPEYLPLAGRGIVYKDQNCCVELAFHIVVIRGSEHKIYRLFEDDRFYILDDDWGESLRFPSKLAASSIGKKSDGLNNFDIFPASLCVIPPVCPKWQLQFLYRNIFLPNALLIDPECTFKFTSKGISIFQDNVEIGDCQYWNHKWEPMHHAYQNGPECSVLKIKKEALQIPRLPTGHKLYLALEQSNHTRENGYGEYKTDKTHQLHPFTL